MLSLILALVVAEPASTTAPEAVQPQPVAAVTKVSKANTVTCKWVANRGGHALEVCMTNREWRDAQIERQQRVDEFQKRALHTQPR